MNSGQTTFFPLKFHWLSTTIDYHSIYFLVRAQRDGTDSKIGQGLPWTTVPFSLEEAESLLFYATKGSYRPARIRIALTNLSVHFTSLTRAHERRNRAEAFAAPWKRMVEMLRD